MQARFSLFLQALAQQPLKIKQISSIPLSSFSLYCFPYVPCSTNTHHSLSLYLHGSREDMQEHMAHHFHSACRGWALLGVSTPLSLSLSSLSLFSSTAALIIHPITLSLFSICTRVAEHMLYTMHREMTLCTAAHLYACSEMWKTRSEQNQNAFTQV